MIGPDESAPGAAESAPGAGEVSKAQWITASVETLIVGARIHYVPATEMFLADAPGDLSLCQWALGPTKAAALDALREKLRHHFERQLASQPD